MNRERIPIYLAVVLMFIMSPPSAAAHLNSTGMGPIYDGLLHFLPSPEDIIPVFGLALLAGLRGTTPVRSLCTINIFLGAVQFVAPTVIQSTRPQ